MFFSLWEYVHTQVHETFNSFRTTTKFSQLYAVHHYMTNTRILWLGWCKVCGHIHLLIHDSTIKELLHLLHTSFINFWAIPWKQSAKMSQNRLKWMQLSVEEALHTLALRQWEWWQTFQLWLVRFWLDNSLLYSLHKHKIWKRSVEKYKSYGILTE